MTLTEVAKEGLTRKAIDELKEQTQLDDQTLYNYLDITQRAIQNYSSRKKLKVSLTDRILDLARLYATGLDVFLTTDEFNRWLRIPSVDFEGEKPISLLDSTQGIKEIESVLFRIQHGIPT